MIIKYLNLSCVELISKLQVFMIGYVAKFWNKRKGTAPYFSSTTVNEFIIPLMDQIKSENVTVFVDAKHYSLIVD